MNSRLVIALDTTEQEADHLRRLQARFAQACNALAPVVQSTRCWNRVALHHMTYRTLRERFPELGSQLACNVIYAVCLAARKVYQDRDSPYCVDRQQGAALPLLHFSDRAPVYFDRHTLSIRKGQASMSTLDGRMRFQMQLEPAAEEALRSAPLRQIVLRRGETGYRLVFLFADADEPATGLSDSDGVAGPALAHPAAPLQPGATRDEATRTLPPAPAGEARAAAATLPWPDYLSVLPLPDAPLPNGRPMPPPAAQP